MRKEGREKKEEDLEEDQEGEALISAAVPSNFSLSDHRGRSWDKWNLSSYGSAYGWRPGGDLEGTSPATKNGREEVGRRRRLWQIEEARGVGNQAAAANGRGARRKETGGGGGGGRWEFDRSGNGRA